MSSNNVIYNNSDELLIAMRVTFINMICPAIFFSPWSQRFLPCQVTT